MKQRDDRALKRHLTSTPDMSASATEWSAVAPMKCRLTPGKSARAPVESRPAPVENRRDNLASKSRIAADYMEGEARLWKSQGWLRGGYQSKEGGLD